MPAEEKRPRFGLRMLAEVTQMLLIFNLGRPDVLPVHDLGVRKGFQYAYGKRKLPEPEQLARYGLRWSPHRSAAAWYLWRAADFLDGEGW